VLHITAKRSLPATCEQPLHLVHLQDAGARSEVIAQAEDLKVRRMARVSEGGG
jgi:hypothetical protein